MSSRGADSIMCVYLFRDVDPVNLGSFVRAYISLFRVTGDWRARARLLLALKRADVEPAHALKTEVAAAAAASAAVSGHVSCGERLCRVGAHPEEVVRLCVKFLCQTVSPCPCVPSSIYILIPRFLCFSLAYPTHKFSRTQQGTPSSRLTSTIRMAPCRRSAFAYFSPSCSQTLA